MGGQPLAPAYSKRSDFIFIDSRLQKDASNEAVKVHAMRKWHRRRHYQKTSNAYPTTGGELQLWGQEDSQSSTGQRQHTVKRNVGYMANSAVATTTKSTVGAAAKSRHPPLAISPYDMGSGRGDPFGQYPYRQSQYVNFMVDFYMGSKSGTLAPSLLSLYRGDPAPFSSFLAVVAWRAAAVGAVRPGPGLEEAEGQALRLVNSRLGQSKQGFNGSTLLAIGLIASLEEMRRNGNTADLHWSGLQRAIEVYGGLQKLLETTELYATIFWLEAIVCTSRDCCLGQLDTSIPPDGELYNRRGSSSTTTTAHNEKVPFTRKAFDFILEYSEFFQNILPQIPDMQSGSTEFSVPVSIVKALQSDRENSVQRHMLVKLASLVYLAWMRLNNTPEAFSDFTHGVDRALARNREGYVVCGEELLHTLVKCVSQLGPPKCIYYNCRISRLLCASRNLPLDSSKASLGLLSCFMGIPYALSSLAELNSWKDTLERALATKIRSDRRPLTF